MTLYGKEKEENSYLSVYFYFGNYLWLINKKSKRNLICFCIYLIYNELT